jgi:hypothetical protein
MGGPKMKRLFVSLALLVMASTVVGDVYVRDYYRKDGTPVRHHYRSDPDGDFYNNWNTYPNVNPYTGKIGTRTMPPNSYPGSYSHGDSERSLPWTRLLPVMVVIALFFSAFIKKDEERKPS